VGDTHAVDYSAGANIGFVVNNPVPDTFAKAQNSPFFFHVSMNDSAIDENRILDGGLHTEE